MANEIIKKNESLVMMKRLCNSESVMSKLRGMLGESSSTFAASMLDLYTSDNALAACDPTAVVAEAMKAAALKLPIAKSLGCAYVVPYKGKPTFILGYRGFIQLALRTGQYRSINADAVYEGEKAVYNRVTGELTIEGEATSDKATGYFASFELTNGFRKTVYWSRQRVIEHAEKRSASYRYESSPWKTDFDAMALKTLLRNILSKYGIMSIEFLNIIANDNDEVIEAEVANEANSVPLVVSANEDSAEDTVDADPGF